MTDRALTFSRALFQETYTYALVGCDSRDYNSRHKECPDFQTELFPVHSPLLKESYLVSFPPLTYMLKFSGFAGFTSCHNKCAQIACCEQINATERKSNIATQEHQ